MFFQIVAHKDANNRLTSMNCALKFERKYPDKSTQTDQLQCDAFKHLGEHNLSGCNHESIDHDV